MPKLPLALHRTRGTFYSSSVQPNQGMLSAAKRFGLEQPPDSVEVT